MINREIQLDTAFAVKKRSRRSSMLRQCLILLLVLTSQLSAQTAAAQDRLTKLDPETLVVHLEKGSGTADVTFLLAQGVGVPEFRWTSAVGSANTIPASDITFKWVEEQQPQPGADAQQQGARRSLLNGQLTVNTRVNVEPDANYTGRLIFYWSDATQPVPVSFTVSDRTTLAFSLAPTKLDLTLVQFQPDTIMLRVKNTGRAPINKLSVSSSDLIDSETQRRLVLPEQIKDFGSTPLAPSREAEVSFKVEQPLWAGSYTGTVDVVANERTRQSIPFAIRSRGPTPGRNTYWIPFILFLATLMLGYLLSNMLENWFNLGGLQRAEAQLSLQKSERELARIAEQIEKWVRELGIPREAFAQTRIRLQHDLNELREVFRRLPDLTREELVAEAKRFATSATLAGIFESAVNVALKQWPKQPEKLKRVLTALDRVAPGTDPNTYRESLRKVLETEARQDAAEGVSALDANAALPNVPAPADLEKRIKRMAQLERAVAATIVFIMAYQLFYAKDFAFGTLLDYLAVFLWSLGLTQMGTQLIARARSSVTPSQ
jgi:hypothetical protein